MQLALHRNGDLPLYQQVAEQIRTRIRSGALAPGARLPTVRQLSSELGLTRLTVHSAYGELQSEGLIESFVGRGTFVAERPFQQLRRVPAPSQATSGAPPPAAWSSRSFLGDMLRMAAQPGLLSFAQAFPAPETYPTREFGRALRLALADPAALSYGPPQGEAALREQVAQLLLERGVVVAPELVLISAGAQQALDLTLRACVAPSDVVLTEEPTYPGFLELAAQRGQRLVGVPVDDEGLRVDALEAACREHGPRLLYLVPSFHNPSGACLSQARRAQLLRIAREHNLLVLEDDVYGLLSYDQPPPALKADDTAGQVIYASSFSKVLMPGLRLGMLVAPPSLLPALLAARRSSDMFCSPLLQLALADYLRRHQIRAHLARVRPLYRERRDVMLAALQQHMPDCSWTNPAGGLCIWARLPDGVDDHNFYLEAIERGIGLTPGRAFFIQPPREAFIRLSFAAQTPERIRHGVAVLGGLVRDHLERQRSTRAYREYGPLV